MDHNTRGFISDKNKMAGFIREAREKSWCTQCPWWDRSAIKALSPSSVISVCDVGTLWRCSLFSSAVICATPGILVKWDPRNIKSEPEICIKIWPEPLTLTTPTATIRVLSKSALGFSIFWHYRLWEKIKKKHFQKSSRTISENQFDLLIKEALGLGSQPVLTPWTFLACTCPAPASPLVSASPAACLCLLNNIL